VIESCVGLARRQYPGAASGKTTLPRSPCLAVVNGCGTSTVRVRRRDVQVEFVSTTPLEDTSSENSRGRHWDGSNRIVWTRHGINGELTGGKQVRFTCPRR
jgi:hypothetical protein